MSKFHISKDGIPRKCPAKIQCRLAHPLAHFEKTEEAQEFADEYNALKIVLEKKLKSDHDTYFENIEEPEKMSTAKIIAINDYIDERAKFNDDYSEYFNPIKWQKQQRNKFLRQMENLEQERKEILVDLDNTTNDLVELRKQYYNTNPRETQKLKNLRQQIKTQRSLLKSKLQKYSESTQENQLNYQKALSKKNEHEEKLKDYLMKRLRNQTYIKVREDNDFELSRRLENREVAIKELQTFNNDNWTTDFEYNDSVKKYFKEQEYSNIDKLENTKEIVLIGENAINEYTADNYYELIENVGEDNSFDFSQEHFSDVFDEVRSNYQDVYLSDEDIYNDSYYRQDFDRYSNKRIQENPEIAKALLKENLDAGTMIEMKSKNKTIYVDIIKERI